MSKFITGIELVKTIDSIIWDAEKSLLIVSPFIKLDDYFKKLFKKHINEPKLHIIIVFGKNENEVSRSFSEHDFEYFKQFPNISIIYVSNLHGKYYGNERKGVVTSINLYDKSFQNNIEFGIYSEQSVLNVITDRFAPNADMDAWDECYRIALENDVIFVKRPCYKKTMLGFSKDYITSETLADNTAFFYKGGSKSFGAKKLGDYPTELDVEIERPKREDYVKPERDYSKKVLQGPMPNTGFQQTGFCIRTGQPIPFNPSKPFTYDAWASWAQWQNYDFQEKYCHRTGKPSYGKTSMRNPILYHE